MPKPEDLFSTLAGGQKFSKLDLENAYQQLKVDPSSRKYLTISTHKGLYQYTRLPFGVASAPAIFQHVMERILDGITGVCYYLDDILVTGESDQDHLQNLQAVLQRLQQSGLRLMEAKCKFMEDSVQYLGYQISAAGIGTAKEKVEAALKAPTPFNTGELRSFLGLVNYLRKIHS